MTAVNNISCNVICDINNLLKHIRCLELDKFYLEIDKERLEEDLRVTKMFLEYFKEETKQLRREKSERTK